jgi:D-alanyl-D-alanine carboxypeptidase
MTLAFAAGCGKSGADVVIDLGSSDIYDEQVRQDAISVVRDEIARWDGVELHKVAYLGDECASADNLKWMNDIGQANNMPKFVEVIAFTTDYHTPKDAETAGAWEPDTEMTDWQFWLARPEGGDWQIVTNGY